MSEGQVEERLRTIELNNALLAQEVAQLHQDIDALNSGVGRGLWIIGGGFIAAFVGWIVSGGMAK
jgi:hypothetical protein|tara:strand:+ start:809 stop:1003 length:195 start_codon:yes stop_codon:yes gene_type:complete